MLHAGSRGESGPAAPGSPGGTCLLFFGRQRHEGRCSWARPGFPSQQAAPEQAARLMWGAAVVVVVIRAASAPYITQDGTK